MGIPIGILGFLFGGMLGVTLGCRQAFVAVGLFGCGAALVAMIVLSDAPRDAVALETLPPIGSLIAMVFKNGSFRMILIAASLHLYTFHSISAWLPQYYARVFHLSTGTVGGIMALVLGVGAAGGMFLGGFVGDMIARRDARWHLWLTTGVILILVPASLLQFWSRSLPLAIVMGLIEGVTLGLFSMIAITQSLMPQRVRGFTVAIYVPFVNVFTITPTDENGRRDPQDDRNRRQPSQSITQSKGPT